MTADQAKCEVKISALRLVKRDAVTKEVIEIIEEDQHGRRRWQKGEAHAIK
jgi:hypothetical protein